MVETQKQRLRELTGVGVRIAWVPDLDAVSSDSITGVFLSNELVDAFPVHRVVKRPLGLREIFVGWEPGKQTVGAGGASAGTPPAIEGRFIEIEAPPFSPDLEAYFARIGISLEVGQQAEVNLQALHWEGIDQAFAARLRTIAREDDRSLGELRELALKCDPQAFD